MRRPVIVIAPEGGLCNRMQALDSAIALARRFGSDLRLIWYLSPNINTSFDKLFEVPQGIGKITEIDLYRSLGRARRRLYRKYFQTAFDEYLQHKQIPAGRKDLEALVEGRRVYITAYRRFYDRPSMYADLKPVPRLQAIIDSYASTFEHTVGVHVRRTDNRHARDHSPLEMFIDTMHREVTQDDASQFFVATDSPEVEDRLRSEFPGRIVTYQKRSLDRNDPLAIEDAIIDLYCLSRCRKLIGSYWSSFSETAWQLGGIEKAIMYRE
jgi:hypothetical protein